MFARVNRLIFGRPNISSSITSNIIKSSQIIKTQPFSTSLVNQQGPSISSTLNKHGLQSKKISANNSATERVVFWKLYAHFNKHNTRCQLVAVVEDIKFMENNPHLSYNEQVLYYLQLPHKTKVTISAGQLGFRKSQRQEYEAGFQVATKMFQTIQEQNLIGPDEKVEIVMKNFGKGRQAFQDALLGKEGSALRKNVVRMTDATVLKFGGSRSKKLRRL
ncbi:uncharacterized protein J8A68_005673 [[Candida] subhashii]|uniref:Small ribosomal subunit protein uS11m n=1 Tax=[Candida] subhashii TaxID=561895 RepID=A0A8J5UJ61_9ASCO|nr:uncharacterized protein J8A68_005673 [[Candida] subhashii]KAG7660856.1 hypothetical protein J8A68_005673 [[Candida] subhashii]